VGGDPGVNTGEIGCRPSEHRGDRLPTKGPGRSALLSLRKGSSNLEEVALLLEWELPCFPHGFEACFGVYSGV